MSLNNKQIYGEVDKDFGSECACFWPLLFYFRKCHAQDIGPVT